MLQIISNSNETSTGPELVQNGNFSELGADVVKNGDFSATPLGSELIVDGDFPLPNVNWVVQGTSTINGGSATVEGLGTLSGAYAHRGISQPISLSLSTSYKITFTAKQLTGVGVMYCGLGYTQPFNQVITSDFVEYTINQVPTTISGSWPSICFGGAVGNTFEIKDVSVKENINLVTNGDFSATGSELVTDNDFESGLIGTVDNISGGAVYTWALNTVSPISGTQDGLLSISSAGTITHYPRLGFSAGSLDLTKSYIFTFDYKVNSGTCSFASINRGGGSSDVFPTVTLTGSGTFTFYFQPQGSGSGDITINFDGTNLFETQFDNVSVKELGEDWTAIDTGSGSISFVENGLRIFTGAAPNAAYCYQSMMDIGKSYKFTYTVSANSSAVGSGVYLYNNNGGGEQVSFADLPQTVGTHTIYFVALDTLLFFNRTGDNADITLTNILVQELGEDWTEADAGVMSIVSNGLKITAANYGVGDNRVYQTNVTEDAKNYKYTITISDITVGCDVKIFDGSNYINGTSTTGTFYFTRQGTNDSFYIGLFGTSSVSDYVIINSISVQELDPNDYWTLGTGWSIGSDEAIFSGSAYGAGLSQTNITTLNKTFAFNCNLTQGSVDVKVGSLSYIAFAGSSIDVIADNPSLALTIRPLSSDVTLTNVSTKLLGSYSDQSIYVTAADVQTIAQASVYYLVELTSMGSKNSLYFLPSSVVANNGRYTKLNFTVVSKDATPTPASGIISFYDSVGGFDTYPMGFYEFRIYEQTSSTNLDPLLATGLLEKGFAFVRDFSGNMQELTDGFKEYDPTLTQYVYSK